MLVKYENESQWLAARGGFITSTEAAALFGLSEWKSRFQVWHEKSGGYTEAIEETNAIRTGKYLEDGVARMCADEQGWTIEERTPYEMFVSEQVARLAASYDRIIQCPTRGRGLLEIKIRHSRAFDASYDEEALQMPADCEIQIQTQMGCAGIDWACHAVFLIDKREFKLFFRRFDAEVFASICAENDEFWQSVYDRKEPKPDFDHEADREYIMAKIGNPVEGSTKDLTGDNELPSLCADYKAISGELSVLEAQKEALKAQIVSKVGIYERVSTGDGFVVTSKLVQSQEISYIRDAYRTFRVDRKDPNKTKKGK